MLQCGLLQSVHAEGWNMPGAKLQCCKFAKILSILFNCDLLFKLIFFPNSPGQLHVYDPRM